MPIETQLFYSAFFGIVFMLTLRTVVIIVKGGISDRSIIHGPYGPFIHKMEARLRTWVVDMTMDRARTVQKYGKTIRSSSKSRMGSFVRRRDFSTNEFTTPAPEGDKASPFLQDIQDESIKT